MKIAASLKIATLAVALVSAATPLPAQTAPRMANALSGPELADLETVRKAVWVDWFSGDTTSLHRVLGPELVAISPWATHWQSLDEALAASARFRADGGRLVSVSFDSTLTHRFGETVIMFSHYTVITENGGQRETLKGRATEVFVRANGRWLHTSWHLDAAAS